MADALQINQRVLAHSGRVYEVKEKIGEGGQGRVYRVTADGLPFALKWYFQHTATRKQRLIIEKLLQKNPPDDSFLWPIDLIESGGLFGYVMPLRPPEYKNIVDLMKRRVDPSFRTLAIAAANLARGYKNLHSMGYSYCDISFGNVFFHPHTGRILICDNDNVTINGMDNGILGTPRFMAPELVVGNKKPSTDTDLYSMALLLFYMFMIHHPLEGALEASIKALDLHAMRRLYGTHPVFIWDPEDKTNRPVRDYQDNAILYWDIYPKFLKELFVRSFTEGLHSPKKRIVEKVWQDAFVKLLDSIMLCPSCGAEVFFDEEKSRAGAGHVCWHCQAVVPTPPVLQIGKKRILLHRSTCLLRHHLKDDYDLETVIAQVVQNPADPAKWGVRNLTDMPWVYCKADGTQLSVEKGRTAAIGKNASIRFGTVVGAFQEA